MKTKRFFGACLVALVIFSLISCDRDIDSRSATAKGANEPRIDIRGTITHMRQPSTDMSREGIVGAILVESDGQAATRYDVADIYVTTETHIGDQGDSRAIGFSQLTIGQNVEVQFDGEPQDTDPPLGRAKAIAILPGAP